MVFGGLLLVFAARSPATAGSTVTAPAGAFAGPAAGSAHTRATDEGGVAVGFGRASGVLSQPVTVSRANASGAAGHAQGGHLIPTRPPSRGT
ncbi:hypothetical protein GCM10010270_67420 [Streptomyces violaceus]|nr:hypothetical protein GCM10010270_67420 [Streptomyces janthinus]